MQILMGNIDQNNKKALYKLTKSESVQVKDLERGTSFPVDKWCLYEEENSRGELQQVLSFTSGEYKVSTISKTFIRSFLECAELMGEDPFSIIITGGETKSGRTYVNCELDCD